MSEDDLLKMGLKKQADGTWSKSANKEYKSLRTEQDRVMAEDRRRSVRKFMGIPEPEGTLADRRRMFFDGKNRLPVFTDKLPKSIRASKNPVRPRDEWFDGTEPVHEYVVQLGLSIYTLLYYPEAEFKVDAMGNGMSQAQGGKLKEVNKRKGWPDFELYDHSGPYCGLFLELKTYQTRLFKKNGEWYGRKDKKTGKPHLESQNDCHIKMRERGWKGGFVKGIAQCLEAIDCYTSGDFDRFDEFILTY